MTLLRTSSLARAYWYAKKLDRSIPLYEEVVPKLLAHLGPDHVDTIQPMADLGWVYRMPDGCPMPSPSWSRRGNWTGNDSVRRPTHPP